MSAGDRDPVVAVEADVLDNERVGAYQRLTLAVPGVAATARPGHFAALTVGGETSGLLLRRSFSIHRVAAGSDPAGDRLEIVVADAGPGTHWLTQRTPGDRVGVLAPLGNGFSLPAAPGECVLIGGGYGSAPLPWLAEHLRAMGSRVHMILGAATRDRLFGAAEAAAVADSVHVVTVDGSAGAVGLVTGPLRQLLRDNNIVAVYACGPMWMLRAVGEGQTAPGTLKLLQKLLAKYPEESYAYKRMTHLFGVYDLRGADAHLSSSDIEECYSRLGVDRSAPLIQQAAQLIENVAEGFGVTGGDLVAAEPHAAAPVPACLGRASTMISAVAAIRAARITATRARRWARIMRMLCPQPQSTA